MTDLTKYFASRQVAQRPRDAEPRRWQSVQVACIVDGTSSMRDEITLVRDMFQQLMATLAGRYKRIQMTAGIYRDEDCRTPFAFYGARHPKKRNLPVERT